MSDLRDFREALADGRVWVSLGIVVQRAGEDSHFEIDDRDVLVEVDLVPEGQPLTCRLGGLGGGVGHGIWRIPPAGTEVVVLVPGGEIEQADPVIVAVLSTGQVPNVLDGDTLVVRAPKVIVIESGEDDVKILPGNGKKVLLAGSGKGVARKDDPTADGTLVVAFSPGTGAASLTLTYTPGDGSAQQVVSGVGGTLTLKGKIAVASTKVEAG